MPPGRQGPGPLGPGRLLPDGDTARKEEEVLVTGGKCNIIRGKRISFLSQRFRPLKGVIVLHSVSLFSILDAAEGELSQEGNFNATARLLLLPKYGQVAKIYTKDPQLWEKNLLNLEAICQQISSA